MIEYWDSLEYYALEGEGDRLYSCQECGASVLMENWSDKYMLLHAQWHMDRP